MKVAVVLALLAVVGVAVAERHVLYTRGLHPRDHTLVGRADGAATVRFTVAMRQQGVDELDRVFWDRSNPESPNYRKWLTHEEVAAMVYTTTEDKNAVVEWLSTEAGVGCKALADALVCSTNAATAEALFHTQMNLFSGPHGFVVAAVGSYSIPAELKDVIRMVTGLSAFPVAKLGKAHVGAPSETPDYYVVPETIQKFYQINGASGSSATTQGVGEFQDLTAFTASDLSTFISQTGVPTFDFNKRVGPFTPSPPQAESTLDVQYLGSTGRGNTNWYWTSSGWMYEFSIAFAAADAKPSVFSMSYGWAEDAQCNIDNGACSQHGLTSTTYVQAVNTEFQKIGVQGVTMMAASGDGGAHGKTDPLCLGNPKPGYPASSPYILAVGATQIQNGQKGGSSPFCTSNDCAVSGTEIVCSTANGALITTGGGFSGVASRPQYQDAAVASWMSSSALRPKNGTWNQNGRGYPDVAALGHKYYIEYNGQHAAVDGTSASSPVFAGVVGLINAHLQSNGKSPLGFANPFFYKMFADKPETFHDVTSGDNTCTESFICCKGSGYGAASGWDPTTGLGTPNVAAMLQYVSDMEGIPYPKNVKFNLRGN